VLDVERRAGLRPCVGSRSRSGVDRVVAEHGRPIRPHHRQRRRHFAYARPPNASPCAFSIQNAHADALAVRQGACSYSAIRRHRWPRAAAPTAIEAAASHLRVHSQFRLHTEMRSGALAYGSLPANVAAANTANVPAT
jgi:hypothetical protein